MIFSILLLIGMLAIFVAPQNSGFIALFSAVLSAWVFLLLRKMYLKQTMEKYKGVYIAGILFAIISVAFLSNYFMHHLKNSHENYLMKNTVLEQEKEQENLNAFHDSLSDKQKEFINNESNTKELKGVIRSN